MGTFEGKTYTLEAVDAGWTEVFEVGQDYEATFKKNNIILVSTYKGKADKVVWRLITVEEI